MKHIEIIQSYGVALAVEGPELVIRGLKSLEPERRRAVIELAKAHKPEIIRELCGPFVFDIAYLADMLRAAGLAFWLEHPYEQRPPVLVVKAPDGNRVDFPSWNPTTAPEVAVKDYIARHYNRVAGEILEWMKAKAYPPGMCELCGAVSTWVEQYGKGFRCSSHTWHFGKSGKSLPIETARKSCPLSTRSVH